jgi:hypothetical protein
MFGLTINLSENTISFTKIMITYYDHCYVYTKLLEAFDIYIDIW